MPKFAPNTGFKMPGVGSKNIDSPGNFRDEQHVDKVGYCDTTEDRMLPEGSSPLKVRYTTTGYRKDLKEVDLNLRKKKEQPEEKKQPKEKEQVERFDNKETDTPEVPPTKVPPAKVTRTSDRKTTADQTNFSGGGKIENDDQKTWMTGEKSKIQKANPDYTPAQVTQAYRNKYNIGKSTTTKGTTTTVYKVNGKITDKAGYDAAGPSANKSIS